MARPRTINGEVNPTFNCDYPLKIALIRAAKKSGAGTTSDFIRDELSNSCQRALGEQEWQLLRAAADPQARRTLVEEFVRPLGTSRVRGGVDASIRARVTRADTVRAVMSEIEYYLSDLRFERDLDRTDLTLCVGLHETVDILSRIKLLLGRPEESMSVRSLRALTRKLCPSLRADIDAGILAVMSDQEKASSASARTPVRPLPCDGPEGA